MISELLDGTRVIATKEGLLKWLEESGSKWGEQMGSNWKKREKERWTLWRETSRSIRRPRGGTIECENSISSVFQSFRVREVSPAFSLSSALPFFPSFFTLSQPHLGSWLALASLSLRTTYHFSSSPSFLPLSNHILKNPLRRFALAPRPLSYLL